MTAPFELKKRYLRLMVEVKKNNNTQLCAQPLHITLEGREGAGETSHLPSQSQLMEEVRGGRGEGKKK